MGVVLELETFGRHRKGAETQLPGLDAPGDMWADRHRPNPHTAPFMRPGRDAGSIADLIAFAKTGGPIVDDQNKTTAHFRLIHSPMGGNREGQ